MKYKVEKLFDRDVNKIKDKKALQKLQDCIFQIENVENIGEISNVKKMGILRFQASDYHSVALA